MSIKYLKNIASPAETLNYNGQDILTGEYFEIPTNKEGLWVYNSNVIEDLGTKLKVAKSDDGNQDIDDTAEGLKYLLNEIMEVDEEGRQINRIAYGKQGWTYMSHPIEFETSKLNSLYEKNWLGNDRGCSSIKFYDSNGTELVAGTQAELDSSCVETRITFNPDFDYEIISGKVDIVSSPSSDVRMWVMGGVIDNTTNLPWEYPAASGIYHAKEFAGGLNFKYIDNSQETETDGRASKFMPKTKTGVPFNCNQFQIRMRHDAGVKCKFMLIFEYFRA
jgi:hypothetical protein